MVAFEKRYQGISSDLGFVDFRRLLNIFDVQTKEEFVFGMFQTWNGSLGHREVVLEMFQTWNGSLKPFGEFVLSN